MPNQLKLPKTGFTLVELLVVISIIVVMSGIALTLYQSAQSQARDSQRMADLKAVQAALEQYHNDLNSYPPSTVLSYSPTNAFDSGGSLTGNGNVYIGILPRDPLFAPGNGNLNYVYYPLPSSPSPCNGTSSICTNYCLGAKLENTPASVDASCAAYITSINSGYNYYISKSSNF